ncbi:NADH-quinone oxidoreductase subunit 5 family protein [Arabiibacter massiliensis]|uniref:NADH-quinone oxidoreductase subunit 5 family protein n=1 Tax=Arabiibacter massiliensis TaxID=1870985 RepID=UPI001E435B70|nr:proton-conducting transporter membrane subunit [Arabiibacter massiliensis]
MALLGFLILFPLVVAGVLLIVRNNRARNAIVAASALVIALASVWLAVSGIGTSGIVLLPFGPHVLDYVCTGIGVTIAAVIFFYGVKYRNVLACVLAAIQATLSLVLEFGFAWRIEVHQGLYFDSLSLLMALIIGIIGSGICVYAIGYMEDFHAHHQAEGDENVDRRPRFFALMFLLLGAMFGVVFSNNMHWLFSSWEITTLCSFLLIGYTRTGEAIGNAFRQVTMNMLGGIAFLVALIVCASSLGTLSLIDFLVIGVQNPALVVLPVTALAFAGLVKAAQMPFHTWLLGAMVAPTPTSALLHSSTMVKAGVFLLVKLAPVMYAGVADPQAGFLAAVPSLMVVLVGGITFALCSFMAISQTNAKRVLAYSTIANLGLIAACAGVGTPEAVWAAAFLILFHAIAKSLLFLCVGTAEHHIGSRDIEDMDLLFERMPRLARFMMLGILCMFIAPFGMLVAKWATLVSFAETGQVALIIVLAFGSAATFMFWAKWLGKLSGIAAGRENVEEGVHKSEWIAILAMAVLVVLCCVGLPVISWAVVEPYVYSVFGALGQDISAANLWIASILSAVVAIVLFAGLGRSKAKRADVYLAGVSRDNAERTFSNSLSGETAATARNWYLEGVFGEARISPAGTAVCALIIIAAFAASAAAVPGMF